MTPDGVLGIGIVGCGGAALDVAAAIGRGAVSRVSAVHDLQPALAADLAARIGGTGATVHPTLEALLDDPAVDAVYVALPHDLLAPTALRALAAGRSVLVEKPMATDLPAIAELDKTARAGNLTLGVLFELRATGPAVIAAGLVRDGTLGTITAVRIRTLIDKPQRYWSSGPTGRATSPWRASRGRAGGGVVLMNSIHQIDLVLAITGLRVTRVAGEIGTLMTDPTRVDVEDTAAAVLRFSNGAIGSLVAGAHVPGALDAETIELDGTQGSLRLPDLYGDGQASVYLRRAWGELPADRWTSLPSGAADPYRDAVEGFVLAARERRPAPVGAAEAAAALDVVLRLYSDQHDHEHHGRTA